MSKRTLHYILLILLQLYCTKSVVFAQKMFYQDMCNCGVTGAGFSTGMGLGSGNFDVYIEPGSVIRKAFLFTYSMVNPEAVPIKFDNQDILFTTSDVVMNVQHKNSYASPVKLYYKDVTTLINPNNLQHSVQFQASGNEINEGFWTVYLYVIYENPILHSVATAIIINEQDLMGNESYTVNNINSMDNSNPIGFSLYTDRSAPFSVPNCKVYFNNNLLGTVGGSDNVNSPWSYAGVKGHFYYQNNQLFGLDDDTPNAIMAATDGLADVSSYLTNNATSCNFQLKDINYPNQPANGTFFNLAYFLTYTSPCGVFPVSVSPDTTICQGSLLQLTASGGQSYKWQATTSTTTSGLSCSTCANPIFSGDSSTVYTVQIWNNDSCSVVRPVRIKVHPKPKAGVFSTLNTSCDSTTGMLKITPTSDLKTFYAISENGDTLHSNYENIPQVGAGSYAVFYVNTNGCTSADTTINVNYFNNVQANFTIIPSSGMAPLSVQINNTSQNAASYQWSLDSVNIPAPPTILDTSGTYQIQLIAYDENPACNDTAQMTILVYDSLVMQIPNVFTPNDDGVNDVFTIASNLPTHAKIHIFNRWGNEVFMCDKTLAVASNAIWDGTTNNGVQATEGVYFYTITAVDLKGDTKKINGFFHLVR